jgi:hypothetical protein
VFVCILNEVLRESVVGRGIVAVELFYIQCQVLEGGKARW